MSLLSDLPIYQSPYLYFSINSVHIMEDCFYDLAIALGLSKNSPYKSSIDRKIEQLREGGFIAKWMQGDGDKLKDVQRETRKDNAFTLPQLQGPFLLHGVILVISILAFLGELSGTTSPKQVKKKDATKEFINF